MLCAYAKVSVTSCLPLLANAMITYWNLLSPRVWKGLFLATDVVQAGAVRLFFPAEPPDRFLSYVFTVWEITMRQYLYTMHTLRHRASSVNGRYVVTGKRTTQTSIFRNTSTESKRLTEKLRRRLHSSWEKFSQKLMELFRDLPLLSTYASFCA